MILLLLAIYVSIIARRANCHKERWHRAGEKYFSGNKKPSCERMAFNDSKTYAKLPKPKNLNTNFTN
jgi:hypothetical protein